jgi:DNA-directed RNA polymerase specialized sigma24 family protein|tara:strand:+ start:1084 stop:1758 length:675 start_codon:yes stop_codon:yes gene_type:complete
MHKVYEDQHNDIEEMLRRYRAKWQLTAIAWMDYDDVCQQIRLHIHKKWHLWKQDLPFKPWVSTLISNQIKNMVRNNYTSFAKPCLRCPHYMGGDLCNLTSSGKQDDLCAIFSHWQKKKQSAYNLKLPLSLEEPAILNIECVRNDVDYETSSQKLHKFILAKLSEKHAEIYTLLYIEHQEDYVVAERYGFKLDKSKKTPRYKQIKNLRKKFYEMAQKVMQEEDIL